MKEKAHVRKVQGKKNGFPEELKERFHGKKADGRRDDHEEQAEEKPRVLKRRKGHEDAAGAGRIRKSSPPLAKPAVGFQGRCVLNPGGADTRAKGN